MNFLTRSAFCRWLILVFFVAGFCFPAWAKDPQPFGWLEVNISKDIDSDFDEVVGHLVELGVSPGAMFWIKPAYGNQNILWFETDSNLGSYMQKKTLHVSDSDSESISDGRYETSACVWQFTRRTIPSLKFEESIYIAPRIDFGEISVLFWGTEADRFRIDLVEVLNALSANCK